jgi:hypothetical protein
MIDISTTTDTITAGTVNATELTVTTSTEMCTVHITDEIKFNFSLSIRDTPVGEACTHLDHGAGYLYFPSTGKEYCLQCAFDTIADVQGLLSDIEKERDDGS